MGTGRRVVNHGEIPFRDCSDDCEVTALCDNKPENLQEAADLLKEKTGVQAKGYDDYRKMLDAEELDGVYIAGPNDTHAEMAVACMEAGVHVLCEKPLEVSLAKVDEMIAARDRTGKILAVGLQMEYNDHYHKFRDYVKSGKLGDIIQVWCMEYRDPYFESKEWVWEKERSGGAIVEKNCHHYDIMDFWVDSMPTTVYATGSIAKVHEMSGKKSEIVDNAWILNDYENGCKGMLGVCFLGGRGKGHHREFGIHGTEGKATMCLTDKEQIHVSLNTGEKEVIPQVEVKVRGNLWRDFVDCIKNGTEPLVSAERGRKSLLIPMAAELSIEESRIVHVNELK
jgi:predicted dehydrogenase